MGIPKVAPGSRRQDGECPKSSLDILEFGANFSKGPRPVSWISLIEARLEHQM